MPPIHEAETAQGPPPQGAGSGSGATVGAVAEAVGGALLERAKNFVLVMGCGTFHARAAQAGIRLPPTLEADEPAVVDVGRIHLPP